MLRPNENLSINSSEIVHIFNIKVLYCIKNSVQEQKNNFSCMFKGKNILIK